ncbi:MAG: hypothetical protein GFH27_549327n68 [Chloroflexi bacterium AL-W]|nr:hypothetical protein [Chloroflexi bacterium AL-N1]NOK69680.1 hypothetical protein [Chloroflexi bacterium AL-N10]NOK72227.1 hypothetical protein [Chloroflexi bacterium AL-N5]NOK85056.1 hypothetical protein [Chloroflexi bacterium AL-W]NOK91809.1 hypothetical protein [Chloroflexi bacterium AL-N15]
MFNHTVASLQVRCGNQRFISVDVLLMNSGTEAVTLTTSDIVTLRDGTGTAYPVSASEFAWEFTERDSICGLDLVSGERVRGVVPFWVPTRAAGLAFVFDEQVVIALGSTPVANAPPDFS